MQCPYCDNKIDNTQEMRQIIREELMRLDPDVANSILTQLTTRLGRSMRMQGAMRQYEVKHCVSDDNEVLRDEY